MDDMTPDEARDLLDSLAETATPPPGSPAWAIHFSTARALATLAAMRVEHDHGVVDWEKVDGRYETRHRVRLVSEWRDADPAEAAD